MPTTFVRDVNVHYREAGDGLGVVLLHSAGSSSGQWRRLTERLAPRYRVLAPDLLGYGGTGHWTTGRLDLIADEAEIAAAMIEIADAPVHLVGHSYGGHVAARTALEYPEYVQSLTLIEPSLHYLLDHAHENAAYAEIRAVADPVLAHARRGELEQAARIFLDYWMGEGTLAAMAGPSRAAVIESMRKLAYQWPHSLERQRPALSDYRALAVPTLLIQGTETTLALQRLMQVLCSTLPNCELVFIEGAGHMSAVTHAAAVNAAIESHLEKHAPPMHVRQPVPDHARPV